MSPMTLDAIATDPATFDALAPAEQAALYQQVAILEANLKVRLLTRCPAEVVPEPDRLIDAKEAAKLLGTRVDYVWAMMRRGQLPWVKVGKKYKRLSLSTVRAYLAGKPVDPTQIHGVASKRDRTPRIGRRGHDGSDAEAVPSACGTHPGKARREVGRKPEHGGAVGVGARG